ncbi:MAG TPA: hypothetical protein VGH19_21790 [Verrucomicrobiae bacterium]
MKGEISWKGRTEEGEKREVYAKHVGDRWLFFVRGKRHDQWKELPEPPLEDWLELLDGVQRRISRRRFTPIEEIRLRKRIKQLFPDAEI